MGALLTGEEDRGWDEKVLAEDPFIIIGIGLALRFIRIRRSLSCCCLLVRETSTRGFLLSLVSIYIYTY